MAILSGSARVGAFALRHSLATAVVVGGACLLWTVIYFALFLYAFCTGGHLGGPFAYPAGLLFFLVAAGAASVGLFFPSTACAEWIVRSAGWGTLAQIPLASGLLAGMCGVAVAMISVSPPASFPMAAGILWAGLLIPMGLYWWTAQSPVVLLAIFRRVCAALRITQTG